MKRARRQSWYEVGDHMDRFRARLEQASLSFRALSFVLLLALLYLMERVLPWTASTDDMWAVWWPPNGFALALLLIAPRSLWIWILIALGISTGLVEPTGHGFPWGKFVIGAGNMVEILIPALTLPPFRRLAEWLQSPRLLWKFVIFAVVLGPLSSSILSSDMMHVSHQESFWIIFTRWTVSDSLGMMITTPLVLVLVSPETYRLFEWRELPSTIGVLLALLGVSCAVFLKSSYPLTYVVCPFMLFVAMRTGFSGAVLAINLLAPLVTESTLRMHGPFSTIVGMNACYRMLAVQGFLLLIMLMAFPISVLMVQQKSTAAQLKKAFLQMEQLASADGLTGVANRRRFDEAFDVEWRRAARDQQPLAIVMLDVDNFKAYNDCYGHPAGDACLRSIAQAISDIPRRGADLVARYGGEEFVMLLPSTDEDGARALADLVCANVRRLGLPHGENVSDIVTISIGYSALIPAEGLKPSMLIEASDRALYRAKKMGRNRVESATLPMHVKAGRRVNGMQLLG